MMLISDDDSRFGWETLAKKLGVSERTVRRHGQEYIEAGIVDFPLRGRPPKKVMRWDPVALALYKKRGKKSK
jgi:predicted ArsR family transcriptional regulator